jgi:hypothetical protein
MAGPPVIRVSTEELRRLFNEASYLARTLNGTFINQAFGAQSVYQNPPDLEGREPEPEGTLTGLIEIIDPSSQQRRAVAHRLLRPDRTFGASGLPDPKMVFIDGVIYIQKRKEGRHPQDLRTPSLFSDDRAVG